MTYASLSANAFPQRLAEHTTRADELGTLRQHRDFVRVRAFVYTGMDTT